MVSNHFQCNLFLEAGKASLNFHNNRISLCPFNRLVRSSGKRTLSKMNALDFIATIVLGSASSTVMRNKTGPLQMVISLILLIYLQYLLTYPMFSVASSIRNRWKFTSY
jgi:hypothetical protein